MKEKILLVGGGGHCVSCIDVIEREGKFQIAGIIDKSEKVGEDIFGYDVIGTDDDLEHLARKYKYCVVTLGQIHSPEKRIALYERIHSGGMEVPTVISPLAYVSKHAVIGEGTIVMHFAQVNAGSVVGCNSIINSKSLIEHDAIVEDHCHVSTGAIVNGSARIGKGSFLGSGSVTIHGAVIEQYSFVKAGALAGISD